MGVGVTYPAVGQNTLEKHLRKEGLILTHSLIKSTITHSGEALVEGCWSYGVHSQETETGEY